MHNIYTKQQPICMLCAMYHMYQPIIEHAKHLFEQTPNGLSSRNSIVSIDDNNIPYAHCLAKERCCSIASKSDKHCGKVS